MFNACLAFLSKQSARHVPGALTRPVGLLGCVPIVGALHFLALSGCALEERPGDGLVTDGNQVVVAPMLPYDRPRPPVSLDWPPCKALDVFAQKVVPHLVKRCVECHDGTNGNAIIKLATFGLEGAAPDPTTACQSSLAQGAKEADKNQVGLLVFVDPARADKDHEFKYEDLAEFNAYKADVMTWLNAERP